MDIEAVLNVNADENREELYRIVYSSWFHWRSIVDHIPFVTPQNPYAIDYTVLVDPTRRFAGDEHSLKGDSRDFENDDMVRCAFTWLERAYHKIWKAGIDDPGVPKEKLFTLFMDEMVKLICTNDRAYTSLRKTIKQYAGQSQIALISVVAAAVGAQIGVTATAILIPLVAIVFLSIMAAGKNAFCKGRLPYLTLKEARKKPGTRKSLPQHEPPALAD
jgi:hypothetical protein